MTRASSLPTATSHGVKPLADSEPHIRSSSTEEGSASSVAKIITSSLPERLTQWGLKVDSFSVSTSGRDWPVMVYVKSDRFIEDLIIVLDEESYLAGGPHDQANGAMNVVCALIDERFHEKPASS